MATLKHLDQLGIWKERTNISCSSNSGYDELAFVCLPGRLDCPETPQPITTPSRQTCPPTRTHAHTSTHTHTHHTHTHTHTHKLRSTLNYLWSSDFSVLSPARMPFHLLLREMTVLVHFEAAVLVLCPLTLTL